MEEIQCVVCFQFPYKPLECKKCNKLFCKYCQLQLQHGVIDESSGPELRDKRDGGLVSAGRDGRGRESRQLFRGPGQGPDFDVCCPNC